VEYVWDEVNEAEIQAHGVDRAAAERASVFADTPFAWILQLKSQGSDL